MIQSIRIEARFRGPDHSGNGGYVCGLLAQGITGPAEVTLRSPPPLDRPLQLESSAEGVVLRDGEAWVAQARPAQVDPSCPAAPSWEQAQHSATHYAGFARHAFPECFVCGPARAEHDGLRIFPGRLPGTDVVAAPWIPDASLPNTDGVVTLPCAWASIDCPGYFAVGGDQPALLGRMSAEILRLPRVGERYIAVGWPLGRDRRKLFAGTALYDAAGALCGRARQTWILLHE